MNLFRFLPVCTLLAMSTLSGLAGNIPQYRVTTDAPPYTPIENGIPITWSYINSATIGICPDGILENSGIVQGFPIGFELRFGGRWVNQFVISSSGQLYLGEDEVNYDGTDSFTVGMSPVSNGVEKVYVTYLVEGEAGDRRLTVQFADVTVAEEHSPKGRYNMQIRLFEADSHIEIAFEELQAPYGECQGFDVSLHGWDAEDSLVLTATDIADPPTVSPHNAASMLNPETYVRWNEIPDGRKKLLHYRLSPESSRTAPTVVPDGLTVTQTGSSLDINVHRASDADATLVLWSKSPITDAEMPGDGDTFPASTDATATTMFGDAMAVYYGPAKDITLNIPDIEDSHDYYVAALSANGYPAFNVTNIATAQVRTTQPAPNNLYAISDGPESMNITCRANYPVIIASTSETMKGYRKGYIGTFGNPAADVMPGDQIPGGGTVIYVGEPTKFNFPCQPNEIIYLRAWTVTDGQVSANSIDTYSIPEPTLPFEASIERYPWGEDILGGWVTGGDFAPWYRSYYDDFGVLGVSPEGYFPISISTPLLKLDVPVKVTFELAMETVRNFGEGNEPGWFGEKGYLHVKTGDGAIHKVINTNEGEMVPAGNGYVDFSSTFVPYSVTIPSRGNTDRITWEFSTQKNTACFLRNISVTPLSEEPHAPLAHPTLLKASEDEDGIIHISCRRAEDAAYTLVLFSSLPMTDRELPVYGEPLKTGSMIGNATVLYFGTDEEVECCTSYIENGEPHFIFADYDTDYYIRAISASEAPIYNVTDIAELTYRALPDPAGILDIKDATDSLDIYTVTGLRIDTPSLDRLPAGIYIVNGKKLIIN